jgi:hypothetical protein
LCGAYQFSGDVGSGLLNALRPIMTLSAAIDDPLRDMVTLLSRELVRTERAQQIVLDRLLDLLLVLAIRSDFRRSTTTPRVGVAAVELQEGHVMSVLDAVRSVAPRVDRHRPLLLYL